MDKQIHDKPVRKKAEEDREELKKQGDEVDLAIDESFPASDAPSFTPGTIGSTGTEKKKH